MLLLFLILQLHYNYNPADYPDAAGLIIDDRVELKVDKDFKKEQHRIFRVYIFNTRGRERYADFFEKYNSKRQNLILLKTRTVLESGKIIQPEKKAISDLSTVQGFIAPAYKHYRTRSVSYSDVNAGVLLEYESKKTDKYKSSDKHISGIVVFQKKDPILHKEYSLRIPAKVKLHQASFGGVKFKKIEDGGFVDCCWWVDSTARLKSEPGMIPLEEFAPRVVFTNFKDWSEVGGWLWKKFEKAIVVSKEMKNSVAELKGKERIKVISSIYGDAVKNWRDIPLGVDDVGYTPMRADKVYKNRYGNQIDKCALLIALLGAADIEAYPAYISFSESKEKLPLPDYFKSVVVAVPYEGRFIYLDPRFPERGGVLFSLYGILFKENSNFPLMPDIVARYAFIVKPDTFLFSKVPGYKSDIADLDMDINVTSDRSITGTVRSRLTGICAVIARSKLRHKKEKEQIIAMEKLLGQLSTGAKLKDFEIKGLDDPESDVEISVQFECLNYLIKEGDRLRFVIPPPLFTFINIGSIFGMEERIYPFTVWTSYGIHSVLNINFPENLKVIYLPPTVSVDNPAARADVRYRSEPGVVKIEKRFVFKKSDYQPDEFSELQDVYNRYRSIEQQLIILE